MAYFGSTPVVGGLGGTGIANTGLTINLGSAALGDVLTSDSSGNATWAVNSAIVTWSDQNISFNAVASNGYFITGNAVATLPASPNQGDTISFNVTTSNTLTILANTGQYIQFGNQVTGSGGIWTNSAVGDAMTLVYQLATTTWHTQPGTQGEWSDVFTPLAFSPALWLDGADPAGTGTPPSAGTLATWVDKSGNANNATGGTSPTYVTAFQNGLGAVEFLSTPNYLISGVNNFPSGSSGRTEFYVIQINSPLSNQETIFDYGTGFLHQSWTVSTTIFGGQGWSVGNGGGIWDGGTVAATTNYYMCNALPAGGSLATMVVYQNGSTVSPSSNFGIVNTTPSSGYIGVQQNGTSDPLNGYIMEILIYPQALSPAAIATVNNYIHTKWNI